MKRDSNEKRAFWLFLFWVIFVTCASQPHLSAQDDDMFIVEDDAASGKAPATASDSAVAADQSAPDAGEGPPADGEEVVADDVTESGEPAELPALSADPNELLAKVNGIAKAGKHDEVITQLEEHEDAVAESKELMTIYVEALIKTGKPDWNRVNRQAKVLSGLDRTSSLADYAQGMYFLNSKKPDAAKAISFLSKAKSAKKPYPAAAMAYYMAVGKRFWPVGIVLVGLPLAVVIKKKRAKKKVEISIDLDGLSDNSQKKSEANTPDQVLKGLLADDKKAVVAPSAVQEASADAKPDGLVKKIKKIVTKKTVVKPAASTVETESQNPAASAESVSESLETKSSAEIDDSAVLSVDELLSEPNIAEEQTVEPEVLPVIQAPRPVPQAPYRPGLTGVKPVVAEPEKAAPVVHAQQYTSVHAKHQAEIEQIREISKPGRPAVVAVDSELEALWSNLSRKAIQGKISPQYRRDEDLGQSVRNPGKNVSYDEAPQEFQEQVSYKDVSIDLSEESLKEDLVCKLKMMAISDSELRELFAQKNPRHIPHLIEYIMTRPEPVRLAFVAREIGVYEDPAVIDMLASLLYNEDNRVALGAVQGLEKSKKIAAVVHLCPFLRSDVPVLAQAARTALSNFGAVKILQAFKDLPSYPDPKIREAGIFVLSRMQGGAVEDLLKKMLSDDSLEIRNSAILAMSYQKNPIYIDALREFFRTATDTDKTLARKAMVYLQGFVTRKK